MRPLPPSPLPHPAGEGEEKGVGPLFPGLAPWAISCRPYRGWQDLHHEPLGQETSYQMTAKDT